MWGVGGKRMRGTWFLKNEETGDDKELEQRRVNEKRVGLLTFWFDYSARTYRPFQNW